MRREKKSETLEIRLPLEAKQAFMDRCRDQGVTASEAIRGFIEAEVAPRGRRGRWAAKVAAGAMLAAAAGAVAAPTLARPADRTAEFKRLDANHDGVISLAEYLKR